METLLLASVAMAPEPMPGVGGTARVMRAPLAKTAMMPARRRIFDI